MEEKKDENPLDSIFILNSKGKPTEEINDILKITDFFKYLKDENIDNGKKIFIIEELIKKFKINRYTIEYFSHNENQSIYLFLFDIYLQKDTSHELQNSIINLLNELRVNIETSKEIYEYIFQKLSKLYRGEEELKQQNMKNYLNLLYTILDETDNIKKPRNYFCCNGKGRFIVDINENIFVGYSFSIFINFKISKSDLIEDDIDIERITNLVILKFSNNHTISVDLKYPFFLLIKEIKDDFITQLKNEEWINLLINFYITSKNFKITIYINGEKEEYKINPKKPLNHNDTIDSIEFFNNFYGEVGSMIMFTQKEQGKPGVLNKDFIMLFNGFKGGLWKKKYMQKFIKMLNQFSSIDKGEEAEKVMNTSAPKKM